MTPTIYLALTHDWELRGDGSGEIEKIQFAPMRRLLEIYQQAGARTTFLPDVMQQIRFRNLEDKYPGLKTLADLWDEHAREAFRQRHDIQLHLHPQWLSGEYDHGRWRLSGDWSLLKYDSHTARLMLEQGKNYLERLLQPTDPHYRCIAFRAGALAAAPSNNLFGTLADLGIQLDVSIAPGLVVNDARLSLDYRNCEESFLPYYPSMTDARRISNQRESIVCVPLNHFYGSRRAVTRQNISLARKRVAENSAAAKHDSSGDRSVRQSRLALGFEKLIKPALARKYFVSDTGRLNYPLMKEMLASIRQRARETGLPKLPVVFTNHPKDIRDWDALERFVGEISQAHDIKFITLAEMSAKLRKGEFQIAIR